MANFPIDVPLPDHVKKFLERPKCLNISLPKPSKAEVCLPFGGKLSALSDVTKAFPDECTLTFSLLLQLGPIMAPLECLIKALQFVGPLIEVVKGLPTPD